MTVSRSLKECRLICSGWLCALGDWVMVILQLLWVITHSRTHKYIISNKVRIRNNNSNKKQGFCCSNRWSMIPATPRPWVQFQGNAKPVYLECKHLPYAYCKCLTNDFGTHKNVYIHVQYTTVYKFGVGKILNVFERSLFWSLKARTHRDEFRACYSPTFNASWLNKGRQCECAHRREKCHT